MQPDPAHPPPPSAAVSALVYLQGSQQQVLLVVRLLLQQHAPGTLPCAEESLRLHLARQHLHQQLT
jgi:hypothetical protein